jgi:hypothetical protein
MKNKDLELIYKMSEKIPKTFPLNIKEKILRNKFLIRSELEFIKDLISVLDTHEISDVMLREYEKSSELSYINIDELPENINELGAEFLEGLFLITIGEI